MNWNKAATRMLFMVDGLLVIPNCYPYSLRKIPHVIFHSLKCEFYEIKKNKVAMLSFQMVFFLFHEYSVL